jgi:hypothetical protein
VKRSLILALAGLGLTTAACSSASSSSPQVSSTLNRINAAVSASDTAHFTDTTKIGSQTEIIVGSAGASSADETLLVNNQVSLRILKINGVIYLKDSSASALEGVLGISKAKAPTYTTTWISVTSSDKPYSNLSGATTLVSELHGFLPTAKGTSSTVLGPTTVLTQKTNLSGSNKRTSNLTIITASAHPISGIITVTGSSGTESKSVTFSQWGKPISPTAPSGAVSLSSIVG